MTTFVSRLASLVRFGLGSARYRRRTLIQLAFVTKVVLVLPFPILSALLQPHISPTTACQFVVAAAPIHSFQVVGLVG